MTQANAAPRPAVNAFSPAALACALAGAGLGLGSYALIADPARREATMRIVRELGLPTVLRNAGSAALVAIAERMREMPSPTGHQGGLLHG